MNKDQTIAYISDVGAEKLKPLFIAGSAVTVVSFDTVFIFEKWLRHRGRLAHHTTRGETIPSVLSAFCSIVGACGLIFLSIFDTLHYPKTHDKLLVVFIIGYLLTAIFVCAEYQRLGIHLRQHRILRLSFWMKLTWVFIFLGLAIGAYSCIMYISYAEADIIQGFGVENVRGKYNTAAKLEWSIGFLFAIFVASFAVDFLPAIRTRGHGDRFPTKQEMESARYDDASNNLGGPAFSNGGNTGRNF